MPHPFIQKIRSALGRTEQLHSAPIPPQIDEPITRLVHSDFGLPELFAKAATDNGMCPELVYVEELPEKLIAFLNQQNAKKIALPISLFLQKIGIPNALQAAGLAAKHWPELTLNPLYDYDASVTDVYAAVAETGSLVIRGVPEHGRALSLVPPIHVAILEPKNFLPDLVDLFQKLNQEALAGDVASNISIVTGPSRTADIELTLVVGVHGPVLLKVFILK